jgi:hypothetical protein
MLIICLYYIFFLCVLYMIVLWVYMILYGLQTIKLLTNDD